MAQREFYITARRLRANGACEVEVERFVRTFAEHKKVGLTDKNFEKAVEARLPIWWLAMVYLGNEVFNTLDGDDNPYGPYYEMQARRYWKHIKAKLAKDKKKRPPEWY